MRKFHRIVLAAILLLLINNMVGIDMVFGQAVVVPQAKAKNIIFMVADGMGLACVTATRIYLNGPKGDPLSMETLSHIGYQRVYSLDYTTPDSAAASSAWAAGEKFKDSEVSCHWTGSSCTSLPTILELAESDGRSSGLVATSSVTHATPAAWGAHVRDRDCEYEIARQYIQDTDVDVILGGGKTIWESMSDPGICPRINVGDLIVEAQSRGYRVVYNRDEMNTAVPTVKRGNKKMLGLFTNSGMTPEVDRGGGNKEPHLWEMTAAALEILETDRDGFCLLIEGSQVDWANHDNDFEYMLGEMAAFDSAVKVVLDWINESARRRAETLMIITADHDTGGFGIPDYDPLPSGPGYKVVDGWIWGGHTGVDTLIWSQGPGSQFLGRAIENTDVYWIMKRHAF